MRTALPVVAVTVIVIALIVLLGGGADGLPKIVREGVAAALAVVCFVPVTALFVAPGLGDSLARPVGYFWERLRGRSAELRQLKERVEQLQHAHHMVQLGGVYFRQGRFDEAAQWFTRALEKEDDHVDARYKLARCHFEMKRYQKAAEILEEVHAQKPGHDYGGAYLHLARSQQLAGNDQRAGEIYAKLLRFYPGHPEGTYRYARLLEQDGEKDAVRARMRQIVSAVRNSPRFQRRRNRHWMLMAQWWLLRN